MDIDQIIWADSLWADNLQVIFDGMLSAEGLKGYPTNQLEINFSLSYCQGDGVGWFGNIDTEELFKEHPELIVEYFQETLQLIQTYNSIQSDYKYDMHDTIEICSSNHGWNNTIMHVNVESSGDMSSIIFEVNEHKGEEIYKDEDIYAENEAFEEYLQEWFDDIAHRLERIGYDDIESMESEDNIVESLESDGTVFLKDGTEISWAIATEEDLKHTGGVMGV